MPITVSGSSLQLVGLHLGTLALALLQLGRTQAQVPGYGVPGYKVTYQMNRSTVIMPCNYRSAHELSHTATTAIGERVPADYYHDNQEMMLTAWQCL